MPGRTLDPRSEPVVSAIPERTISTRSAQTLTAAEKLIVHGKRRITADAALRLARYFGTSAQFWINLQTNFDLEMELDAIGPALAGIQPLKIA